MAETGNIEKLAKIVSKDIFKWFKWGTCKPKDMNWNCVLEHHAGKKTHPSDVVFYYDDPYSGFTKYYNTDLKSYAKESITKNSLKNALFNLSMATECANISTEWQNIFLLDAANFDNVSGLLFIYNHDNEYDRDFIDILSAVEFDSLSIAEDNQLFVLGPNIIRRLNDIVSDMRMLKSDDLFPGPEDYSFFYPDLIRSRRCGDEWGKPATIESLTSPWLIIKHRSGEEYKSGFVIYYHHSGETVEEFIYLLDAMSHYQMFSSDYSIRVRFTDASSHAPTNFEKAKREYLKMWGDDQARKTQMEVIEAENITNFTRAFNPMEIGMREDA